MNECVKINQMFLDVVKCKKCTSKFIEVRKCEKFFKKSAQRGNMMINLSKSKDSAAV